MEPNSHEHPVFLLLKIAAQIGATVTLEPEFGYIGHIIFKNGKTSFFRRSSLNINPSDSVAVAKDKSFAAFFLSQLGYPIPEGQTFTSERASKAIDNSRNIDDAYIYAKHIGFPVIVKPNSQRQGKLVTKVFSKREFYSASRKIFEIDPVMIVQRYYMGNDFRILVLNDEVVTAFQRLPLTVVGDGHSNITELLNQKFDEFQRCGRAVNVTDQDFRIALKLQRQKLKLSSIPLEGEKVQLLDNANLSAGGDAVDFMTGIHSDWCRLAVEISARMGLRLCGIDVITADITTPPSDYILLEINGTPSLSNYGAIGVSQNQRVEDIYRKILLSVERCLDFS